jgi:polyribonucleotide nucleotidyltransferase
VVRVEPYGVFVKLGKNKLGLCHVSNLGPGFVADPRMQYKVGDKMRVRVIKIDEDGKIQLKKEI